jgi:hypothetical protein
VISFILALAVSMQDDGLQKKLEDIAKEIIPLVAKEAGKTFKTAPEIGMLKPNAFKTVLKEEFGKEQAIILKGKVGDLNVNDAAEYGAEMCYKHTLSFYSAKEKRLFYVEENLNDRAYKKNGDGRIDLKDPIYLRYLLILDHAYALADQNYKFRERMEKTDMEEEYKVCQALARGYASWIAWKIARAEGKEAELEKLEVFLTYPFPAVEGFKGRTFYQGMGEKLRLGHVDAEILWKKIDEVVDKTTPNYDWISEAFDVVFSVDQLDNPKLYLMSNVKKKKVEKKED